MRYDLASENRCFYTQALKYGIKDLLIPTEWFYSKGIEESKFDRKSEMLVPISYEHLNILKKIESIAITNGLQIPSDFQSLVNNRSNEEIFKFMGDRKNMYIKFDSNAVAYDKGCKPMKIEDMQMGDYRVAIHVKGLYIGPHAGDKLASLQLRITQVQNSPNIPQCIFCALRSTPTVTATEVPPMPQTNIENISTAQNSNKKGRKPKLQRQNALSEQQIQQEQQAMETLTSDFFNEVLSNN